MPALWLMLQGSRCGCRGLWFKVQGLRFRVEGFGVQGPLASLEDMSKVRFQIQNQRCANMGYGVLHTKA